MNNTMVVFFPSGTDMVNSINNKANEGWTIESMVPHLEGGYQSGSHTAGMYVVFKEADY